ncbi:hypothetical protein Pelo_6738 [Pelomyxa schiedti]|nr:hypothetical protein Pelo_6738 [Pelomyxa schiedti]
MSQRNACEDDIIEDSLSWDTSCALCLSPLPPPPLTHHQHHQQQQQDRNRYHPTTAIAAAPTDLPPLPLTRYLPDVVVVELHPEPSVPPPSQPGSSSVATTTTPHQQKQQGATGGGGGGCGSDGGGCGGNNNTSEVARNKHNDHGHHRVCGCCARLLANNALATASFSSLLTQAADRHGDGRGGRGCGGTGEETREREDGAVATKPGRTGGGGVGEGGVTTQPGHTASGAAAVDTTGPTAVSDTRLWSPLLLTTSAKLKKVSAEESKSSTEPLQHSTLAMKCPICGDDSLLNVTNERIGVPKQESEATSSDSSSHYQQQLTEQDHQ